MRVHANAHVFDDGRANGTLQVRVVGGDSFLYRAVQGEVTVEQGTIVELILTLERVGEDGAPTGETDLATVRPSPSIPDFLICDILDAQVHFEAEGNLGFRP
jgi:hypothetical protein